VRPDRVVVASPPLDDDLRLLERVEDLAVEQLVPELAIEAFVVAVLPRAARLDVKRLHAYALQPLPQGNRDELRAVVRPDVVRHTMVHEQLRDRFQDVLRPHPPLNPDRQALACVLVDHRQHPKGPAVMGAAVDEVIGPDMVPVLWPQAET